MHFSRQAGPLALLLLLACLSVPVLSAGKESACPFIAYKNAQLLDRPVAVTLSSGEYCECKLAGAVYACSPATPPVAETTKADCSDSSARQIFLFLQTLVLALGTIIEKTLYYIFILLVISMLVPGGLRAILSVFRR